MKVQTISKEDVDVVWRLFDMMENSSLFSTKAYDSMNRVFTAMFECVKEDGSVDLIETDTNKD